LKTVGFIGTGSLACYFVEGLVRAGVAWKIMVSHRNAAKAENLRLRFGVTVAENQDIADAADLVVACLLPSAAPGVLRPLRFRPDQTVLSVMSGSSLETMRELVAPAAVALSMMPGLANAFNAGPSVLYPDNAAARALLEKLGKVHVFESEAIFMAASVMGAFSGMTTLMMRDAMEWFERHGLCKSEARQLVAEILKGNAISLLESPLPIEELARGFVTPGGITEQGRKIIDRGGSWNEALDAVLHRLHHQD
jgi:pyrroline-5-carboxylate reductase